MKVQTKVFAIIAAIGGLALQQASATVVGVSLGTASPPATLGGYSMSSYDPGSIAGTTQYTVGSGWATWGQGYTGHVYVTPVFAGVQSMTFTLIGGVEAVYFYEEPNTFADFEMIATDSSGVSISTIVNGDAGSAGIGFYESVSGGPYLTSITVTCTDDTGFAIGEFGISGGTLTGSVPDAGWTCVLLVIGMGMMFGYRRFVQAPTI